MHAVLRGLVLGHLQEQPGLATRLWGVADRREERLGTVVDRYADGLRPEARQGGRVVAVEGDVGE